MDISMTYTFAFAALTIWFGLFTIKYGRELKSIKKRQRFLHERLEAVEKFNGLGMTNTDIRQIK